MRQTRLMWVGLVSTNPHLTLTLSPPIEWERRGKSRRTRLGLRKFVERRQNRAFKARQPFGNQTGTSAFKQVENRATPVPLFVLCQNDS